MRIHPTRYGVVSVLLHWVLALIVLVLLGGGWYVRSLLPDAPARDFLLNLHVSLGLSCAAVVIALLLVRSLCKPPPWPEGFPSRQARLHSGLHLLTYVVLALLLLCGYLQAVFSAAPLAFWGEALPVWGAVDARLEGLFATAHAGLAFLLAALIVVHIGLVMYDWLKHPELAGRMALSDSQGPHGQLPATGRGQIAFPLGDKLAKNLRFYGWLALCFQLVIALISGLLLVVATSGRAFSPSVTGMADAVSWSGYGLLLLCLALLLDFQYLWAARHIAAEPEPYLQPHHHSSVWFLGAGLITGLLGTVVSFTGVALSIALLIAKTVSQPPGIAITDPSRIVRALDVFVLMVNFNLLLAHVIGTGISLWLIVRVSKARQAYALTAGATG